MKNGLKITKTPDGKSAILTHRGYICGRLSFVSPDALVTPGPAWIATYYGGSLDKSHRHTSYVMAREWLISTACRSMGIMCPAFEEVTA